MNNMKVDQVRRINIEPNPQPEAAPSPASPNPPVCPLTWEPFTDPVIAPNGVTYNADAIYTYIQEHGHLPTDDRPVTPRKIWPDQNMRDRLSAHPTDEDEHLEDPITFETMTHPVVASDGRTYNQSTLEALFRKNKGKSPFSRAQLASTGYRNQALMTELNPQVGPALNAALATEPTRNLVTFEPQATRNPVSFEPQAEPDALPAQPHTAVAIALVGSGLVGVFLGVLLGWCIDQTAVST